MQDAQGRDDNGDERDDIEWIDVELAPREVLHGAQDGRPDRGLMYFGRPFTTPVDLDGAPDHLRAYAEEHRAAMDFRRVVVHLNLAPRPGESFTYVTVGAQLVLPDSRALFRDVSPQRLSRTVNRDAKVTFSADIGVAHPQAEKGTQYESREDYLVARGMGTTGVQWEFRKTNGQPLDGVHTLTATVSVPRGMTGTVLLSAAAGIRRRRRVIGHTAQLPPEVEVLPIP
jgi:hypothetical protein